MFFAKSNVKFICFVSVEEIGYTEGERTSARRKEKIFFRTKRYVQA